jgi:hypothetical protein
MVPFRFGCIAVRGDIEGSIRFFMPSQQYQQRIYEIIRHLRFPLPGALYESTQSIKASRPANHYCLSCTRRSRANGVENLLIQRTTRCT